MKAILFALIALTIYSVANTIIERRIANVSPLANTTYIYFMLFVMSAPVVFFREHLGIKLTMPDSSQVWILFYCSLLFLLADLAWFQAYHSKGRLEQITATFLALPLLTALVKGLSTGIYPTKSDILSWIIVAIGLIVSVRQPVN